MLADGTENVRLGRLDSDTHLPATAKVAILEFIADQLPRWRDHPQRPIQHAETRLTEHLCDYLNHIANFSAEWSHIQFRTEAGDETYAGRKIDLAVKPRTAVVIEGRRHTLFDILLPIECKRLPTPTGTDRDEREYVISKHGTTGGIQRFKAGYHGAVHRHGGMVAFVQEETCEFWSARVSARHRAYASLDSNDLSVQWAMKIGLGWTQPVRCSSATNC
jgi:hypothetical protein